MNVADIPQWLLAAGGVAGIAGGGVAALQSRATKRRLDAEAEKLSAESEKLSADAEHVLTQRASTVNAMALGLLEPMEKRINDLTAEVSRLTRQVNSLTDRLRLAHEALDHHGIPFPPLRDPLDDRDVHDRAP